MDKLIEILKIIGGDDYTKPLPNLLSLPEETRSQILIELKKLPQFEDTKNFIFLDSPIIIKDGEASSVPTMVLMSQEQFDKESSTLKMEMKWKVIDGDKVELYPSTMKSEILMMNETVKIYSIGLTPTTYTPIDAHEYEDVLVTPSLYDPTNFEPFREIRLKFSPEKRQDIAAKTSTEDEIESFKKEMYEKLDKAIEILLTKGTNYKQNKNIIVRISDDSYAKKTIKQREFKTI